MARLSIAINEIYLKFLPMAEKVGITLDLDFPDPTIEVEDTERIKKDLEKSLKTAVGKRPKSTIKITVVRGKIIVTDSETVLSKQMCEFLSVGHIKVKSKVGFGTTVTIDF